MNRFWVGFSLSVCYDGFVQDLLGHDRYLMVVDQAWIKTPVWFYPLMGVLVCFLAILGERFPATQKRKRT